MDYSNIFVVCLGIGTVFFGLVCLIVLTTIMGAVVRKNAPAAAPVPAAAPAAVQAAEPDRGAVAAAISAAVAEELGADITGIRIYSMKKL